MAQIIEMPLLSDTMTEGVIATWHKKIGDSVKAGDLLADVETDKATMEVESYYKGVILYIAAPNGGPVAVSDLMAIIGEAGEDVSGIVAQYAAKKGAPAVAAASPTPTPLAAPAALPQAAPAPVPTVAAPVVQTVTTVSENGNDADSRLKASPLAKALAKDKGIDLAQVHGSGDGGRVVRRDIEGFVPQTSVATAITTMPAPVLSPAVAGVDFEDVMLSQMRKTIARRLSESKFTAPHFYLTMAIEMDNAVKYRTELNTNNDVKLSFNDIIIKAVAVALRKNLKANASWGGDFIRYNHRINIGMAVAVDEGLVVPVIRDADTKGLNQLANEARDFATRARERKLKPEEMQGNTFSISNLGMFGIEEFTAIINPPDACILAVGAIQQQPVVRNGELAVGNVMRVTLSCDHRVVDGAVGSAFLQSLKFLLENPLRMLL
jgi:pyruvate dehydrogenase E2 component (dihydrolipoamide acetyltransferase)